MIQLIDLERHHVGLNGAVFYDQKEVEAEVLKYVRLPMDLPVYMRVMRITKQPVKEGAVTKWEPVAITMELDLFVICVKLFVRVGFGPDRTYKIITEDGDGRTLLAEYER